MESPSEAKSFQACVVRDQQVLKSDQKETNSTDSKQEICSTYSAASDSSEIRSKQSLARTGPFLNSSEEQAKTASLMEKREELKRLIIESNEEISELKNKINKFRDLEWFTDGLNANLSAVEYLKLAIKNKKNEISTLEAVIQNKVNMENIMKMKILQIQAKVTKSKAEKASSHGSFISINSYSQNLETTGKIEYTSRRQCECLIF